MSPVVDLDKNEVRVLLSGLHNLAIDKELLDYLSGFDYKAKDTIENLICKFEDTFKQEKLWDLLLMTKRLTSL